MKKFLLIALAVAMMMTLAISALAAEITSVADGSNSTTGDVTVNVTEAYAPEVYQVVVEWGDLAFEYTTGSYTWNPETLTYDKVGESGWVQTDGTTAATVKRNEVIKVTNNSNVAIKATADAPDEAQNGVTVTVSDPITVASVAPTLDELAAGTTTKNTPALFDYFDVTLSGQATGATTIAITVSIEKAA